MIHRAKGIIRAALHSSGAVDAVRRLRRRAVRILMYHHFSSDSGRLREQCEHIRNYYQPVSLELIGESLQTSKSLPYNPLAVTVDDGYRDFFLYAYPVFRDCQIPVTVFLVSDFVDRKLWLWGDQLEYLFQHTSTKLVSLQWINGRTKHLNLGTNDQRLRASNQVFDALIRVTNHERLKLMGVLSKMLGVEAPALPPPKLSPLSWVEIKEMARSGVTFGAHTRTHPILSRLRDADSLREEIEGCKQRIEEEIGQPVLHFSYPNGKVADFNKHAVEAVRRAGFLTAVTSERGMNLDSADSFLLRRIGVEPLGDTPYFRELLAGIIDARGCKPRYDSLK
jgi:peptidoglycan/xylan/chitin deacetylase (PgdA/CDA1 family)